MHVHGTSNPHGASNGSSLRGAQLPVWKPPGLRLHSIQPCKCLPRQLQTTISTAWHSAAFPIEEVWHDSSNLDTWHYVHLLRLVL